MTTKLININDIRTDGLHQDIDMMIDWLKQVKLAALDEIKV